MASIITRVVEVPAAQPQLPKSTPTTPTFPDTTWSLFPAPTRKPRSRSVKMPSRKPLPPTEPVPELPISIRSSSVELSRGGTYSSETQPTTPELTDDSDASQDDERDQNSMTDFIHTYYNMSHASRYTNQEFLSAASKPVRQVVVAHDRVWATDVATTLEVALPTPGSPAHILATQAEDEHIIKARLARDLKNSRSFSNLKQRSPARRRIPRNHPDVLSTIQAPKFALSSTPHSAPLPSTSDTTSASTRSNATFETWPPRTSSSVSVPMAASSMRATPTAPPTVPLPPLPRPSMRPRAVTDVASRPSMSQSRNVASPMSENFPPMPTLEKSFWEHDDDDEPFSHKKGHNKGKESLSKIFHHARNLSGGSSKETVPIVATIELPTVEKKKNNVWRAMFGLHPKKHTTAPVNTLVGFYSPAC